jgi:hypothetical protein
VITQKQPISVVVFTYQMPDVYAGNQTFRMTKTHRVITITLKQKRPLGGGVFACLDTVLLFLSSVVVCTSRLIFGVLSFAFIAYTRGSFLVALLAFAFVFCFCTIYTLVPAILLILTHTACFLIKEYFIQIPGV